MEEEWLMETSGRMMDDRSVHYNMESVNGQMGGRCKDDFIETEVYMEFNFIDWLVVDLKDMGVEDRMIAMVRNEARIREESVVVVERQPVYPHHHGRVHTPLPGPVTIFEKGV